MLWWALVFQSDSVSEIAVYQELDETTLNAVRLNLQESHREVLSIRYTCGVRLLSAIGVCGLGLLCLLTISCTTGQDSSRKLAAQDSSGKLVVGVLQESGTIIPFARYDGTRWSNTWPAPVEPTDSKPLSLAQIPSEWLGGQNLPTDWRLWLPGGTKQAIHVLGPDYIKSGCGENWGLRTDFPKSLNSSDDNCPVPAIGIALSTDQELQPMRPSVQSQLSRTVLEAALSGAEEREIAEFNASVANARSLGFENFAPLDPASRAGFPIKVEHLWQGQLNSIGTVSYFEAVRRYAEPTASPNDCPRIAAFAGWTLKNAAQEDKVIDASVKLTDCDFKEASFVTPLGLLEFPNGIFAITQINGWESQSYAILKIESSGVSTVIESPVR
jgi:hypothetical protein